jgi:hypothetical protein
LKAKRKKSSQGTSRLDSIWSSGRDSVFASGGRFEINHASKKEEPPMPFPWPGEETIMLTDREKETLKKANRKLKQR